VVDKDILMAEKFRRGVGEVARDGYGLEKVV